MENVVKCPSAADENFLKRWTKMEDLDILSTLVHVCEKFFLDKNGKLSKNVQGAAIWKPWKILHMRVCRRRVKRAGQIQQKWAHMGHMEGYGFWDMGAYGRTGKFWGKIL